MEQEQVNNEQNNNELMDAVIYECKIFTSSDGRRVEQYAPSGLTVKYKPKDETERKRIESSNRDKPAMIGVIVIGTENGPKELKFGFSDDVTTLEQAFDEFSKNANLVIENLKKQREEYIKKIQAQKNQQQNMKVPEELKGFKVSNPEIKKEVKDRLNISED